MYKIATSDKRSVGQPQDGQITKKAKKSAFSYWLLAIGCWLLPSKVFAASLLEGLTGNPPDDPNSVKKLITNATQIVLGLAAALAIIMIVWGGIQYISAGGNPEKAEAAKKTLLASVVGLTIVVFAYLIVVVFVTILGGRVRP